MPRRLREGFAEEKMLEWRLEQSIDFQSILGERDSKPKPGGVGEAGM